MTIRYTRGELLLSLLLFSDECYYLDYPNFVATVMYANMRACTCVIAKLEKGWEEKINRVRSWIAVCDWLTSISFGDSLYVDDWRGADDTAVADDDDDSGGEDCCSDTDITWESCKGSWVSRKSSSFLLLLRYVPDINSIKCAGKWSATLTVISCNHNRSIMNARQVSNLYVQVWDQLHTTAQSFIYNHYIQYIALHCTGPHFKSLNFQQVR